MIIENYTFSAALQQITFADFAAIRVEGLKLITNLVTGTIIYQFNNAAKLGTVSNNILTLTYDTTSMSDSDPLMVIYDDITIATSGATLLVLNDLVQALKQIRKSLEASATQDAFQRQRVVVEACAINNNTILGAANVNHTNVLTQGNQQPTVGAYTFQPIWEGPVDQRYRVADAARTMAYLQRQNLTFS